MMLSQFSILTYIEPLTRLIDLLSFDYLFNLTRFTNSPSVFGSLGSSTVLELAKSKIVSIFLKSLIARAGPQYELSFFLSRRIECSVIGIIPIDRYVSITVGDKTTIF